MMFWKISSEYKDQGYLVPNSTPIVWGQSAITVNNNTAA